MLAARVIFLLLGGLKARWILKFLGERLKIEKSPLWLVVEGAADKGMNSLPLVLFRLREAGFPLRRPPICCTPHLVRWVAGQQGIEGRSRPIHVRVPPAFKKPARSRISGRPANGEVVRVLPKQSDVPEAGRAIQDKNIFRLHVPVDKSCVGKELERGENGRDVSLDFVARKPCRLCPTPIQHCSQRQRAPSGLQGIGRTISICQGRDVKQPVASAVHMLNG